MGRYELRLEEVEALRVVLEAITVDQKGGLIGVSRGGAFHPSAYGLTRMHVATLDSLARKVGVQEGLRTR